MEEYYCQLAQKGQCDKRFNNVSVFEVGENDWRMFPVLFQTHEVWILASGQMMLIQLNSLSDRFKIKRYYESH